MEPALGFKYQRRHKLSMTWARKDISAEERLALATYPPAKLMDDFKKTKNPAFQNAIFDRIVGTDTSVERETLGGDKETCLCFYARIQEEHFSLLQEACLSHE